MAACCAVAVDVGAQRLLEVSLPQHALQAALALALASASASRVSRRWAWQSA